MSDNVAENNATIELQNGTFTSNLTITYGLCSEAFSWITLQFRPPVVHLTNLTPDAMYCYLIIYNRNNTTVDDSCSGTFNTSSSSIQGKYHMIFDFHLVFIYIVQVTAVEMWLAKHSLRECDVRLIT